MAIRKGISLVETMIALAILTLVITAVIGIMVQIIALANSAKLRSGAVALAQENLEKTRGYYQTNGFTAFVTGCFADGTLTTAGVCSPPGSVSGYYQYVTVTVAGTQVLVRSYVYWMDKKIYSVNTDTYFYAY